MAIDKSKLKEISHKQQRITIPTYRRIQKTDNEILRKKAESLNYEILNVVLFKGIRTPTHIGYFTTLICRKMNKLSDYTLFDLFENGPLGKGRKIDFGNWLENSFLPNRGKNFSEMLKYCSDLFSKSINSSSSYDTFINSLEENEEILDLYCLHPLQGKRLAKKFLIDSDPKESTTKCFEKLILASYIQVLGRYIEFSKYIGTCASCLHLFFVNHKSKKFCSDYCRSEYHNKQ